MEGISNPSTVLRTGIEQGISNDEGQKGENGYQVNRKSGCSTVRRPVEIPGIRISGVQNIRESVDQGISRYYK